MSACVSLSLFSLSVWLSLSLHVEGLGFSRPLVRLTWLVDMCDECQWHVEGRTVGFELIHVHGMRHVNVEAKFESWMSMNLGPGGLGLCSSMTRSYVWHDSFLCATWLAIYTQSLYSTDVIQAIVIRHGEFSRLVLEKKKKKNALKIVTGRAHWQANVYACIHIHVHI